MVKFKVLFLFLGYKNLVSQYSSRFIDKQNDFFVIVGIRECPPPL